MNISVFKIKGTRKNIKKANLWFHSVFGNVTMAEMIDLFAKFPLARETYIEIAEGKILID